MANGSPKQQFSIKTAFLEFSAYGSQIILALLLIGITATVTYVIAIDHKLDQVVAQQFAVAGAGAQLDTIVLALDTLKKDVVIARETQHLIQGKLIEQARVLIQHVASAQTEHQRTLDAVRYLRGYPSPRPAPGSRHHSE